MTISGTNLSDATAVDFGGVPAASFTVHYGLRLGDVVTITAVSPPGDVSIVDVQVITGGGISLASPADHFTYVPPPIVIGISSEVGVAGGASLTITGSGLANATAVNFGNLQAAILSDTDNQIVVAVPQSSEYLSNVDVTVTTAGGTSAASPDDQFSYVARARGHGYECLVGKSIGRRPGDDLRHESRRRNGGRLRPEPRHDRR